MSSEPSTPETAIDRRQETVVTHEPGYSTTERTTRDNAAERRQRLGQIDRIVLALIGALEILLLLRFVLKLAGANAASGFATFIYSLSSVFTQPFAGLFATPVAGGSQLEMTTIAAMLVYALAYWGLTQIMPIITDRARTRSTTRSTRETTPGGAGNERTTTTVSKD